MTYRRGQIVAWDPDTFESIVQCRGQRFENLPALHSTAFTSGRGDWVILAPTPGHAASTWFILGRSIGGTP